MNSKTILTCALTGSGPLGKNPAKPVTPRQIAASGIEAARAGASIVHIHVREEDGRPSNRLELYREVVDRIRDSAVDVLINLTTGNGAGFLPGADDPQVGAPGSDLMPPAERVRHVVALKPDICSLDLCTMWMRTRAFINSPEHVAEMARAVLAAGVLPEIEVFDTGDIMLANDLVAQGVLPRPLLFQLVMGAKYGASSTVDQLLLMKRLLPADAQWAAFGIAHEEFRILAQAFMLGGHVRVGFEDNLYLEKSVFAPSNAALVERGVDIVRKLGGEIANAAEARQILGIAQSADTTIG